MAKYDLPPKFIAGISAVSGSDGGFAVVTKPPASSSIAIPAATSLKKPLAKPDQKSHSMFVEGGRDIPLPASPLPPYINRPHGRIRQIYRSAPQTPHPMHHAPLPTPPPLLRRHVQKAAYLAQQISPGRIPPVLPPLARESAAPGCVPRHRRPHQRQPPRAVEPGPAAAARGGSDAQIIQSALEQVLHSSLEQVQIRSSKAFVEVLG